MRSLDNGGMFARALVAAGRSDEIPEEADLYGWLVGSWELEVRHYRVDMSARGIRGEAHFAWVLEGRAVQDLWIMPRAGERSLPPDRALNMYGTTLRVWDAAIKAWRVTWVNPVSGARNELVGRRRGGDIVQLGSLADGTAIRWCFTEVTKDSFRWTGEELGQDGMNWVRRGEFLARRSG